MASEIQELIQKLREAECRRHRESLLAIETLERNMLGSGAPPEKESAIGPEPKGIGNNGRGTRGQVRNVDRVVGVLDTQKFTSLDEIVHSTGLDEVKVRAALYARSTKSRIEKRKVKKRMVFRLATQSPLPESNQDEKKGPSTTERIRTLLREHPAGLRTREIRDALPGVKGPTIGTALYNMRKKAKEVVYDESTQTYRLG